MLRINNIEIIIFEKRYLTWRKSRKLSRFFLVVRRENYLVDRRIFGRSFRFFAFLKTNINRIYISIVFAENLFGAELISARLRLFRVRKSVLSLSRDAYSFAI